MLGASTAATTQDRRSYSLPWGVTVLASGWLDRLPALAALLAVYIVLGILYESTIHPITILSSLPSAGVGALLALLITGTELSVMAIIGVLALEFQSDAQVLEPEVLDMKRVLERLAGQLSRARAKRASADASLRT